MDREPVGRPWDRKWLPAPVLPRMWTVFARTGNPSQRGLINREQCPTLAFDNKCRMVDDPEGEVRKYC